MFRVLYWSLNVFLAAYFIITGFNKLFPSYFSTIYTSSKELYQICYTNELTNFLIKPINIETFIKIISIIQLVMGITLLFPCPSASLIGSIFLLISVSFVITCTDGNELRQKYLAVFSILVIGLLIKIICDMTLIRNRRALKNKKD